MNFNIERLSDDGRVTHGVAQLFDGALKVYACYTLELPWRDHKRAVSCIPTGTYHATLKHSQKFGKPLYFLSVYGRTGIMIHPANYVHQLKGCISLGTKFVDIDKDGILDVTDSRLAVERFMFFTGGADLTITIR